MIRNIEAILEEAQEVQRVNSRAKDLVTRCERRLLNLAAELDSLNGESECLQVVLDDVAYEFSDSKRAHNALSEAADEDYMTDIGDGVYWGVGYHA